MKAGTFPCSTLTLLIPDWLKNEETQDTNKTKIPISIQISEGDCINLTWGKSHILYHLK